MTEKIVFLSDRFVFFYKKEKRKLKFKMIVLIK